MRFYCNGFQVDFQDFQNTKKMQLRDTWVVKPSEIDLFNQGPFPHQGAVYQMLVGMEVTFQRLRKTQTEI